MTSPEEFNQAIRELLEVVRTADLEQVAQLGDLADSVRSITTAVAPALVNEIRMQAGLATPDHAVGQSAVGAADRTPGEWFPYSPILGALNPISPVAVFRVDDDGHVRGEVTMSSVHNGPPRSVHGGMIACLMDELLGSTCVATGHGGFTGTLSVRYQQTVPLATEVQVDGWVDRTEGRKIFAKGEIILDGAVLAVAEGVFIRPKDGTLEQRFAGESS